MGMTCPHCNTHQPFAVTITADLGPAFKASDVIARKLGCGHTVGGEEYTAYEAARRELVTEAMQKKATIDRELAEKLATAFKDMVAKKKVS